MCLLLAALSTGNIVARIDDGHHRRFTGVLVILAAVPFLVPGAGQIWETLDMGLDDGYPSLGLTFIGLYSTWRGARIVGQGA